MKTFKDNVEEYETKVKIEGIKEFYNDISKLTFIQRFRFCIDILFFIKKSNKNVQSYKVK